MIESLQHHFDENITHHIYCSDLEQLTLEVYGNVIGLMSSNDTTHEFNVGKGKDVSYLQQGIDSGDLEDWQYDSVLNDMCDKGLIKPGLYFVRVSW